MARAGDRWGRNKATMANMKLSIETKVAAAVAAAFIGLTVGAIGQGGSSEETGGPNNYGPTNNAGVNTQMSQQGYNSSLSGSTNAEENRQKFSDENGMSTIAKKGAKGKSQKASKHHTDRTRQNQGTQTNERGY
jgi:hypothetical protein